MTVVEHAYAKINLYLEVTGKRPDGYHELVTVMQTVSLSDTLTVTRCTGGKITLDAGGVLPVDESNLVIRAARAYFAATGAPFGVEMILEKRIPMAAGMGGGSADAAATLRALNRLDGDRFSAEELAAIGAAVGADVPFCVMGGTRLCRGIGEIMTPLDNRLEGHVVIAVGGEGVSTPKAFCELDRIFHNFEGFSAPLAPQNLIDAMKKGDLDAAVPHFFNRFEQVIEGMRPAVGEIKRILCSCGAAVAMMSGSGPSVFGVFSEKEDAKRAVAELKSSGYRAFLA